MIQNKNNRRYFIGIAALLLMRGILNAYIPLMDKTEARYAEIARIMQETGNWITPQIDYGVPFWAKPPLSTWLSAWSMQAFGVHEFAVRLPYLLATIILIAYASKFARNQSSAPLIGFILLTIPEFLLHAGVVSTDTMLAFCISMAFLSFWKAIQQTGRNYWGYLFFVFIGFGLLAKGPIAAILTVPPLVIWAVYMGEYRKVFRQLPIFTGSLVTLGIAVPWYYLAETETEGFLEYFILGEHFKRFFDSGWKGDKYGFAKTQPLGIIWVFLFALALPWVQVMIRQLWGHRKQALKDRWVIFLLLWLVWTPFFFTFSSSLIHPYILPSMVPIALIVEYYWPKVRKKRLIIGISLFFPTLVVVATAFTVLDDTLETYGKTDKYLLQDLQHGDEGLYYLGNKSYSSQFYSRGEIQNISIEELEGQLNQGQPFYIIIKKKKLKNISPKTLERLHLEQAHYFNGLYKSMRRAPELHKD